VRKRERERRKQKALGKEEEREKLAVMGSIDPGSRKKISRLLEVEDSPRFISARLCRCPLTSSSGCNETLEK